MTISSLGSSANCGYRTLRDSWRPTPVATNASNAAATRNRRCNDVTAAPNETQTALRYRRTERTALYIETQEGDVVRLRIKARDSLAATSKSDGESTEIAVTSRSQIRISFTVDGDLNAEELDAIRSVVEQAAELATDFFAGDLPEAFAAAAALEIDGSQLARVGLRLSVREQATYASLGARPQAAAPPAAEEPAGVPPAVEAAPAPATDETTSTQDAAPTETLQAPVATPEPVPTAPAPQEVAGSTLALIADFLENLLESLRATPAEDESDTATSLDLSLRLHVYRATLVELAAARPPRPEGHASGIALATETVDALAAAQQERLAAEA